MDLDMGESGSDSSGDEENSERGSGGDTRSPLPDVVHLSSDEHHLPEFPTPSPMVVAQS